MKIAHLKQQTVKMSFKRHGSKGSSERTCIYTEVATFLGRATVDGNTLEGENEAHFACWPPIKIKLRQLGALLYLPRRQEKGLSRHRVRPSAFPILYHMGLLGDAACQS